MFQIWIQGVVGHSALIRSKCMAEVLVININMQTCNYITSESPAWCVVDIAHTQCVDNQYMSIWIQYKPLYIKHLIVRSVYPTSLCLACTFKHHMNILGQYGVFIQFRQSNRKSLLPPPTMAGRLACFSSLTVCGTRRGNSSSSGSCPGSAGSTSHLERSLP